MAALSRYFRDLDTAEDAYQEACLRALKVWPSRGVPTRPLAWLLAVARNYGLDLKRKHSRLVSFDVADTAIEPTADDSGGLEIEEALDLASFRDDFLRLLFTCCHPILPTQHQIALALKIVIGLSVEEIAHAFLVRPKTMEQRITRAKKRIASANIAFETPSPNQREERIRAVLLAIYLLFNEGYAASGGSDHLRVPLCEEAIRLARIMTRLFPEVPEVRGLLALCLLHHARHAARADADGSMILLAEQDRRQWNQSLIQEGNILLQAALRHQRPGAFQIQAAIAATHARSVSVEETDWREIERLYRALFTLQPNPVVKLNWAVAIYHVDGTKAALAVLHEIGDRLDDYAYFHGTRGALLLESGQHEQARQAYERALTVASSEAEKRELSRRIADL